MVEIKRWKRIMFNKTSEEPVLIPYSTHINNVQVEVDTVRDYRAITIIIISILRVSLSATASFAVYTE